MEQVSMERRVTEDGGSCGGSVPKSRHYHPEAPNTERVQAFALYPNPAREWTTLNFDLPNADEVAQWVIEDLSGRVLLTERLNGALGQVLVDTRTLSAGSYVVSLRTGPKVLGTERLIVQH